MGLADEEFGGAGALAADVEAVASVVFEYLYFNSRVWTAGVYEFF